ncbi:hypothetical protein F5X68DRAFT_241849 [Plectosphaerella plurivora]|uniref:Clr5 domain-containing protein n=1 Tax=Plectosphaerella plurivora TaxID=936078 RepID=A0A9P9A723_9PEZI|nr:hypothetical protein F5X68DRAFT_241849 [Plectosphaerella plurivora]
MAKTRAKRLPKEEWARHKEYISDMYISRNASLKEVLDYLHQSGLNSTQHQLRQQLKKWGLKKNMEADEWGRIAHLVAKRSLNGKITSIIRNGRYYGPSKIAKEIGRHCTVSDMTRFTKEPTPVCPSSVTMSTPQPMLIDITWPNSLPWLHFGNRYPSLLEQWCQPLGLGSPLARAVMRLGIPVDLLQLGVFESTQHTLSTPWKLCSSHLVAQNLPTDAPGQAIGILAYILSNNQQRLFFSNGLRVRAQQFDVLCGILVNSGLMELGAAAAYSSDYTAAAVLENLLHLVDWPPMSGNVLASLGQQSIALISWALQSPPKSFARMLRTVIYNAMIRPLLLFRSRPAAIIQKAPASSIQTLRDFGFRPDRDTIVFAASAGCYDVAKGLLKECDTWDTERLTSSLDFMPLDMAIRNNNGPMVQLLIDHGEDVNSLQYQQIRWGRSPLQWAVDKGTSSIIEMLLEAGADVNQEAAENGGATALQLAAIQGYMDVAKTLIDKNADVNAPGACLKYGRTALQGAAENGRLDMAALLLSSGVRTQGSYRNSFIAAVALARNEGHCVVEKMLKERCGWTPEDQAGLKQLVSLRRWTEFLWDDWTDDDSMDSDCLWWYSYPSSEAGSQAYHHLGFATNQEDGRECETVGSGDPDVKVGMATLEKSRSHASTDVTDEDDINCLGSEADLALDGSEEMGAWQEEISWPAFDVADLDGEMTNPFQHPSFDDETWAEAAAPFINDGFWYGPPI